MKRLVRRAATSLLTRILLIEGGTILVACIAMAELTPAVLTGGRTIEVSGADHPVMIRGNRGLPAMAITNLVDNARLHTPPGTTIDAAMAQGSAFPSFSVLPMCIMAICRSPGRLPAGLFHPCFAK